MTNETTTGEARFSALAEPLLTRPGIERSTMMGLPCLRVNGTFFASCDRRNGDLLVKFPEARVNELVADGRARSFTPAGGGSGNGPPSRPSPGRSWRRLLDEALAFVDGACLTAATPFTCPAETLAFLTDIRSHNTDVVRR